MFNDKNLSPLVLIKRTVTFIKVLSYSHRSLKLKYNFNATLRALSEFEKKSTMTEYAIQMIKKKNNYKQFQR